MSDLLGLDVEKIKNELKIGVFYWQLFSNMALINSKHIFRIHKKMNMKEKNMNNQEIMTESLRQTSVDTLILMSELAQEPDRGMAIKELRRRRIARTKERLADAFMLLL